MPSNEFSAQLRAKVRQWAQSEHGRTHRATSWVQMAPDVFELLARLKEDEAVSGEERALIDAAIAYFQNPHDLFPQAMTGAIGYIDDVGLALLALESVMRRSGAEVIRRNWDSAEDICGSIETFARDADEILGSGLARELREMCADPNELARQLAELEKREAGAGGQRRNY